MLITAKAITPDKNSMGIPIISAKTRGEGPEGSAPGVACAVAAAVWVGVAVAETVAVGKMVAVAVTVADGVAVGVSAVGVSVTLVCVAVAVGVGVGEGVAVGVGFGVGVAAGVWDTTSKLHLCRRVGAPLSNTAKLRSPLVSIFMPPAPVTE